MNLLYQALDDLVRSAAPLIAVDFDGTLAPIVPEPQLAQGDREGLLALKALAGMRDTHVAVISGRGLGDLKERVGVIENAYFIGSHGGEWEGGFAVPISREQKELLGRAVEMVKEAARWTPGALVEEKLASVAFHYRNASEAGGAAAAGALEEAARPLRDLHVRHGKKVLELCIFRADKGEAIRRLRREVQASAVVFIGDDVTDEDAFATLTEGDVGIKVGGGETAAQFRVGDPRDVAALLTWLAAKRAAFCEGMPRR